MKSLQEGFENIFDSSTVDYSTHFELKDKRYIELENFHKQMSYWSLTRGSANNEKSILIDRLNFMFPISKHIDLWKHAKIQIKGGASQVVDLAFKNKKSILTTANIEHIFIYIDDIMFSIDIAIYNDKEHNTTKYAWLKFFIERRWYNIINNEDFYEADVFMNEILDEVLKINESFTNIFDSSTVDYASNSEKKDIKYLIAKWMDENTINTIDYKNPAKYRLDKDLNIYVDVPYYDDPQYASFTQYGGCLIRNRKEFIENGETKTKVGDFPDYINFKLCKGYFDCQAQGMTTLRGCPERVEGIGASFWCRHNNLKNLIGGPKFVESEYNCKFNPLESLEGIPEICPYYTLKDHFKVPENMEDELVKRVALPGWIDTYKLFLKRGQYDMIKEYGWDKAYWTKNINIDMNESFTNIFDSSTIDCAKAAELKDIRYTSSFDYIWDEYKKDFIKEFSKALNKFSNDAEELFKQNYFTKKDKQRYKTVAEWINEKLFTKEEFPYDKLCNLCDNLGRFVVKFEIKNGFMYRLYKAYIGNSKGLKYFGGDKILKIQENESHIVDRCEIIMNGDNIYLCINNYQSLLYEDPIYMIELDEIIKDLNLNKILDKKRNCYDAFLFSYNYAYNLSNIEFNLLWDLFNEMKNKSNIYKVYESFTNIFDSSTVDYASFEEKKDIEYYEKQRIIDWLQDSVSIYNSDSGEQLAILDGEGIRLMKMINANTKEEFYEIDVLGDLEFDDCGIDKLPNYIVFHEIKGYFNANGVTFNTLKNFPSVINGDFRICDSAIKSFLNGPEVVGGDLYCKDNPQLKGIKALQGIPKVNGEIYCDKNLEKYIYNLDDSGWY